MSLSTRIALVLLLIVCIPGPEALAGGRPHNNYEPFWTKMKPKRGEPVGCVAGSVGRATVAGRLGTIVGVDLEFNAADDAAKASPQRALIAWGDGAWLDGKAALGREGEARDAFLLCLRPGKYVLRGPELFHGIESFYLPEPWNVPIEVEAGKTLYIGSFIGYLSDQADACGGLPETRVIVRDDLAGDRATIEALAAHDKVTGNELVLALPDYSGHEPTLHVCAAPGAGQGG
jgi:hypothetical protein